MELNEKKCDTVKINRSKNRARAVCRMGGTVINTTKEMDLGTFNKILRETFSLQQNISGTSLLGRGGSTTVETAGKQHPCGCRLDQYRYGDRSSRV